MIPSLSHCVRLSLLCSILFLFSCGSSNGYSTTASCQELQLDLPRLQETIAAGRVYQQFNFLTEDQVQTLLKEVKQFEKEEKFVASGLSNTAKGTAQGFGQTDRSLCAVPWWKDSFENKNVEKNNVKEIATKLQQLRTTLSQILDRNFSDALEHECYYSQSKVGSYLPRHMDERHEELKGSKGWLLPSRRSISWLVYLSDDPWDLERNGGALTAYSQPLVTKNAGPTHNGNLQVGWLLKENAPSQPVYLDSWFKVDSSSELHCILYHVNEDKVEYLTRPWLSDAIQGMNVNVFLSDASVQKKLFLDTEKADQFELVEDRASWDRGEVPAGSQATEIAPIRGSLVLFDSVRVPHQVELIKEGTRMALAGWFHEATQEFPDGFL